MVQSNQRELPKAQDILDYYAADEPPPTLWKTQPKRQPKPKPTWRQIDVPASPTAYGKPVTYIISAGVFAKIGTTTNLSARLRTIIAHNPAEIRLVAVFDRGADLERALHRLFTGQRHRDEWFRIEGGLERWIEDGCSPTSSHLSGISKLATVFNKIA